MTSTKQLAGLDWFKLIAAALVVAIHTFPLMSFSPTANFILVQIIARIAVPFFLMVSGYFVLRPYLFQQCRDYRRLWSFVAKTALLYLAAIIIYLPLSIYAGYIEEFNIASLLRLLVFDGTFYHLWYLPALILGMLILCLLARRLSFRTIAVVVVVLYLVGLGGDSYHWPVNQISAFHSIYEAMFSVFFYTRNGLFYVPLFLVMGAWLAERKTLAPLKSAIGFAVALLLMIGEGVLIEQLNWAWHSSMYLLLPPTMFFLFQLVLSWRASSWPLLRPLSTWLYIVHPLCIVGVRFAARITGWQSIMLDNSLVFYVLVLISSLLLAYIICLLIDKFKSKKSTKKQGQKSAKAKEASQKGRAWIEVDSTALAKNVQLLQEILPKGCQLMPALKANAYGHGAVEMAGELAKLGINCCCLATINEAIELRKVGIKGEMLILGYTDPADFHLLHRYDLSQTVLDSSYAEQLNAYGKPLKVQIKIDSGMHRLGERAENIEAICHMFKLENLQIEAVFSHLSADETKEPQDYSFTLQQAKVFSDTIEELQRRGYSGFKQHLLSSYGLLNYPQLAGEYARIGIALYGMLSSRPKVAEAYPPLQPLLSLKTRIAMVKKVLPQENISYAQAFIAEREMQIAVLTIGYADGLPRSLSECGGTVLINGQKAPMVGRMCMDQLLVDVSHIADVQAGGVATLIGRQGELSISAYDLAEQSKTITNEILSRLGSRLERVLV